MTLSYYLKEKPLYYKEIDYSRMPRAYESIKSHLKLPKIIQIVGTNGKGSTGRFLAQMLLAQNFSVGHYTSPHIFEFNERIWLNGKDVDDEVLNRAHKELQELLPKEFVESLSYFEYTTFLAMLIFSKECDFVVLEAGLGGEFDATTVFPKILSVIAPIGYDHSHFLGETIEEIAKTKLESIEKRALLSKQCEDVVYEIAKDICCKKGAKLYLCEDMLLDGEREEIKRYVVQKKLPYFQESNLQSAYCAMKILDFKVDFRGLKLSVLKGRCQKVAKNITVDVGHNSMAAKILKEHFKGKKVTLIYNSFRDKEYEKILDILTPIIDKVEVLPIEDERGMATQEILNICRDRGLKYDIFKKIQEDREYLVFGSFLVVEKFLGEIN